MPDLLTRLGNPVGLTQKAETAVLKFLVPLIPSNLIPRDNYYRSAENQKTIRELPCVAVYAYQGPEQPPRTGNFALRTLVQIRSAADQSEDFEPDPVPLHAARVQAITQALQITDLAAQLTAQVDQFTCLFSRRLGKRPQEPEARTFVEGWEWELICCESNL